MTAYRFGADFRCELATIASIFDRYRPRIELGDARRYVWRSVAQYRCQSTARRRLETVVANFAALVALPLLLILVRVRRRRIDSGGCEYLKIDAHMAYTVPGQIADRTVEASVADRYLTVSDFSRCVSLFIRAGAFYPELFVKWMLWVSSVRPALDQYSPRTLVQYCEYSAYSSLRKAYLNDLGIRLANVTHGEELISCRSAFSSFDEYFAWDITPTSIHDAMHIEIGQRFTFNPCAERGPAPVLAGVPTIGFLWPSLPGRDITEFVAQLRRIASQYHVIVRPHPNPQYSRSFAPFRVGAEFEISEPLGEPIHNFIDRCQALVGYQSAALLQANLRGRTAIYIEDAQLMSLREYHDYYKRAIAVPVIDLSRYVNGMLSLKGEDDNGRGGR